jgi:hypothetical protein
MASFLSSPAAYALPKHTLPSLLPGSRSSALFPYPTPPPPSSSEPSTTSAPTPSLVLAHATSLKLAASSTALPHPTSALSLYHAVDIHTRTFLLHSRYATQVQAITRSKRLVGDVTGFEDNQYELTLADEEEVSVPASEILLFIPAEGCDEDISALLDLHVRCLLNAGKLLLKLAGAPLQDPLARLDGTAAYFDFDVKQPLIKHVLLVTSSVLLYFKNCPPASHDAHLWLTSYYLKARAHLLLSQFKLCTSTITTALTLAESSASPSNLIPALADLRSKCEATKERSLKRDKKIASMLGKHVMSVMESSGTDMSALENSP